jgi:hypothetical protein
VSDAPASNFCAYKNIDPPELLSLNPQRILLTPAPLRSPRAQSAICPELLMNTQTPWGDFVFFPPPTDGEYNAFQALYSLNQPLAETLWVFNNLVKIPPWTLLSIEELKEFSVLLCLLAHLLDTLLVEYLLHRTFSSYGSLCTYCACSMPT